ncbi:glycoside hydrolase family 13 protein [Fusobacterium sp. MFO224]|uniref:glycoside hydrolase family 13 protein n=1 Tax=Fusobacterium sp. MFO224 TaxID=3378070 RepID=UPI003853709A
MEYLSFKWNDNYVKYNSQDIEYKYPYGAVSCNCDIRIRIKINKSAPIKNVFFRLGKDIDGNPYKQTLKVKEMQLEEDKNEESYNSYVYQFKIPSDPELLFYSFEIVLEDGTIKFYGNNEYELGGVGQVYQSGGHCYQITTYYEDNKTPDWYKESIIYQIFPDRFFNGNADGKINHPKKNSFIYGNWSDSPFYIRNENKEIVRWDFYGGNLKGIDKKLDYIKDLGVNLIYLNPIFEATSNHRYDTGDYKKVDEVLGTEDDLKNLINNAKDREIGIILDGVFNHTGRDSKYFNRFSNYDSTGAYNSVGSPYYDWYKFKKYPNDYECWWGVKDLPCVNESIPSFVNYIIEDEDSVIAHWMKLGIRGWRLDVADELPSKFLEKLRERCHEIDPDSVILGEVWEDATNKISYNKRRSYMRGRQLDSVTNYPFKEIFLDYISNKFDTKKLLMLFDNMKENYPKENFYALANIISSHDVERIITMCEKAAINIQEEIYRRELHKERILTKEHLSEIIGERILKIIVTMQMVFPGVPVIYYGDEVGVYGGKDPDNRRTYPWGQENKEVYNMYKDLIRLRKSSKMFSIGEFNQIYIKEDIYGIVREYEDDYALIIVNRHPINFYDIEFRDLDFEELYNYETKERVQLNNEILKLNIRPLSVTIFTNKKY